jgi:uncharacterized protein YyaL (SSP411 family)
MLGALGAKGVSPQPEKTTTMSAHTEIRKPNRLIHEKSPYLLQHACNPVDWYPWGDEAFAKARQDNKPIFLSIGYSTCHWCHVMERESFENEETAALMNKYFICIKVDREERPDIDKVYMTAVQATTGSGGWPMSVWLTPELKPFFCGTYFPPEPGYGRPGFKEILQRIHDVWETNHDAVVAQAGQITEALAQHASLGRGDSASRPLDYAPLCLGFDQFADVYDPVHGGFGGAPKFPRPVMLNFLFRFSARTQAEITAKAGQAPVPPEAVKARDMALHTLRAMSEGGLFDQLGGGFHRYSVDDHWLVSHFEKMLYDQAQLVSSCLDAYQITHDPFYADIAKRTCDYVLRDMTSPEGGFYSAEDADSEGVEGKFYVWTRDEIEQVVVDQEKGDIFCRYYGVERDGNWEHGNNVLHVALTVEQAAKLFRKSESEVRAIIEDGCANLFAARSKRTRPHRDEKILTCWNGLMISALARAAQVEVGRASRSSAVDSEKNGRDARATVYLAAAQRAARYILAHHCRDGRLWRTATVPAVLDDYACFANGLLDLYETDFDPQWLLKAIELTDKMLDSFYDAKDDGFFQTDGRDPSVIVRAKEDYDGAEPSGNSMATLLLLRLAEFTNNDRYHQAAEKTLGLFSEHLHKAPHAVPQMLCALDFHLSKPRQIVIAVPPGRDDAADTRAMLSAVYGRYLPNKILILTDGGEAQRTIAKRLAFPEDIKSVNGKATAYVCVNHACQLPTTDFEQLKKSLE